MKPCLQPGCAEIVDKGESYCPAHARTPWQGRASFRDRYGISLGKWKRIRARAIRRDGGCVVCGSGDRLEVDHIVPVSAGGGHGLGNLQTLCHRHHQQKSINDRKG